MAIRHTENVIRIDAVRAVPDGDVFVFEVDVTTSGNIHKTLRLAHCDASSLASLISNEASALPEEERKRSFFTSMRRKAR